MHLNKFIGLFFFCRQKSYPAWYELQGQKVITHTVRQYLYRCCARWADVSLGGGAGELSRVLDDAGGDVCAVMWFVQGGVVFKIYKINPDPKTWSAHAQLGESPVSQKTKWH